MKHGKWLKLLVMAILPILSVSALAVTVDYDRTGSIIVALETSGDREDWSGVEISLYRVGDVDNKNQDMHYPINAKFAPSGVDLNLETSAQAEEAAEKLSRFIRQKGISAMTKRATNKDGKTVFYDLPVGMYFAMKTGGTKYIDILPFIVSVPLYQDTELEYNVTVCPKTEDYPEPTPSPTPSPSSTPEPRLPQTGVTRWPIVVLACLAVLFLVIGILAVSAAKRRERK